MTTKTLNKSIAPRTSVSELSTREFELAKRRLSRDNYCQRLPQKSGAFSNTFADIADIAAFPPLEIMKFRNREGEERKPLQTCHICHEAAV